VGSAALLLFFWNEKESVCGLSVESAFSDFDKTKPTLQMR